MPGYDIVHWIETLPPVILELLVAIGIGGLYFLVREIRLAGRRR